MLSSQQEFGGSICRFHRPMEPFLRWAGSKRAAIPELRRYWSKSFRRYVEPFAGSCCLFFALEPNAAILSDLNPELIMTLRMVRRDPFRVIEALRRLREGRRNYYRIRALEVAGLTEVEAAARFIYLNRYCFNGLYRTNKSGRFNVPFCEPAKASAVDEQGIIRAAELLMRAEIIAGDFEETLSIAGVGDFIYLDPPYALTSRRVFSEYLPGSFTTNDLPRLARSLNDLHGRGAKFVITYADCQEGRQVLRAWGYRRIRTRRNIAGFASNRRDYYELISSNI